MCNQLVTLALMGAPPAECLDRCLCGRICGRLQRNARSLRPQTEYTGRGQGAVPAVRVHLSIGYDPRSEKPDWDTRRFVAVHRRPNLKKWRCGPPAGGRAFRVSFIADKAKQKNPLPPNQSKARVSLAPSDVLVDEVHRRQTSYNRNPPYLFGLGSN